MNLQSTLQRTFKTTFRITEMVAPSLARRWATKLFFEPMKFRRPSREARLIQDATIERCPFTSFYRRSAAPYYVRYSWGSGPAVLLVHGWAGRGSQLATMAAPLVDAGYRVITFDAPAHGDSPGRRTNLIEVSNIISALSEETNGFAAIIGHSFGGMAAAFALSDGARSEKLVTIGSPVTMTNVLDGFGHQLNASARTVAGVREQIERLINRPVDIFSMSQTLADSEMAGLIIHDEDDRDVPYEQALLLHQVWPGSELQLTQTLGHRRILRDEKTIARILAFVQHQTVDREAPTEPSSAILKWDTHPLVANCLPT